MDLTASVIPPIFAVDDDGICHRINSKEEELCADLIRESSKCIDDLIDLIIDEQNQNFFKTNFIDLFSTQPFSILQFNDEDSTSIELFNTELQKTNFCPSSPLSGRVVSRFSRKILVERLKKKFRSKKKWRLLFLREKFKFSSKKKRKVRSNLIQTSNRSISPEPMSTTFENHSMIDFPLSPDLSKRKYIYRDITLNNNSNQINWKIFQNTQTSTQVTNLIDSNDPISRPFYLINNSISLPDIRIGLSRHRSSKQLHKTFVN